MKNQEDYNEINLSELWTVILKRKVLIIGLILIAVFLSATKSSLSPSIYRGYGSFNIVAGDKVFTSKDIVDLLGTLDGEKLVSILPKTHLSVTAVKISALKNSNTKIMVTVDAKKAGDIPTAISEVHHYLNNIEIVKIYTKQNKEILTRQSAELSELIKFAPDVLKTYHSLFNAGKISAMGFNPIEVNRSVIAIKTQLVEIEQAISKLNNGVIDIAVQPYVSSRPVGPNVFKSTSYCWYFKSGARNMPRLFDGIHREHEKAKARII